MQGREGLQDVAGMEKMKKIWPRKEKMWLTESPFVRYNGGRIFWRRGRPPCPPPSGQDGERPQTAAPPGLLLGRESRLEI